MVKEEDLKSSAFARVGSSPTDVAFSLSDYSFCSIQSTRSVLRVGTSSVHIVE